MTSARTKESILGKNGEASIEDIQADLQSLREDLSRLTDEIGNVVAAKGAATWRGAKASIKSNLDDAVSGAGAKGEEAIDAVRGVSEALAGAVEEAVARRPYPALALAVAIGFFCGMVLKK
jgi:ElaB/YqjD/DUF883 family membrane-anchored ribosome-binding protein